MDSDVKLEDEALILEGTTLKIDIDDIEVNKTPDELPLGVSIDGDNLLNLTPGRGGGVAVFGNLTITGGEILMRKEDGKSVLSIKQRDGAVLLELYHQDGDRIRIDASKGLITISDDDGDTTVLPAEVKNLKTRVSNLEQKIDDLRE